MSELLSLRLEKIYRRTILDGSPSTRIIRRNFFVESSVSPVALDFVDDLGWLRSLLNEWATAADILC